MPKFKLGAVGLLLLGSLCAPYDAGQAASSPLAALAGSWSGAGTMTTSSGAQERLRCRASYRVASGDSLQLNLRCASESYNFDLSSTVQHRGGSLSGSWQESTYSASGTISGRASGDHIQVAATGDNFSATLSLTTRGDRQAVAIRSQGTAVMAISITLNRR